jgi:hypothetical protein
MAQQVKERIDKWDYMKLKSFRTTKEIVTRLNKQGAQKTELPKYQ